MQKIMIGLTAFALVLVSACASNQKEPATLKDGAREVGTAVGSATREVGQGFKKAGKEIGAAAKEGGRAFRDAVRSDD